MSRLFFLLFFSCYSCLKVYPYERLDFSSEKASYDGQNLFLEGAVTLSSDLGLMQAQEATLFKIDGSNETEFSALELKKQVFFDLHSGASLSCNQAQFNLTSLEGSFTSLDAPIYYQDYLVDTHKLLEISSKEADFSLAKLTNEKTQGKYEITSLIAKNNVQIEYANTYFIEANRARYTNEQDNKRMLEAFTHEANTFCTFTSGGNKLTAKSIEFDINSEELSLDKPTGEISSFFFSGGQGRLCTFSSNRLFWDHHNRYLQLEKEIEIQDDYFGSMEGKESLFIFQSEAYGKHVIQKVVAKGESIFTPKVDATTTFYRLTSYGTLEINRDALEIRAASPLVQGKTPLEKQFVYEKEDCILYADQGVLSYTLQDLELKLSGIDLSGKVRFKRGLLYSLADNVSWDPSQSQISFVAEPNHHVMFWNKEKKLKIRAEKILMLIDPETKEETLQAEGVVHFEEDDNILFEQFFPS